MTIELLQRLALVAPWAAIAVTILVLIAQNKRAKLQHALELILSLEERFHSVEFRQIRAYTARLLRYRGEEFFEDSPYETAPGDILDLIETLAYLTKRHAIPIELAEVQLGHWVIMYWAVLRLYVLWCIASNPGVWDDVSWLAIRIMNPKGKIRRTEVPQIAPERLARFLQVEEALSPISSIG